MTAKELRGLKTNAKSAGHLRLRALRPHAAALHPRREAGRHRPQLRRHRPSARDLRPDGEQSRIRRRRDVEFGFLPPRGARRLPDGGDPGVSFTRVPARLYRRRQTTGERAQGPRRQAHRRAALCHDGGDRHPRPAAARPRRRSLWRHLGRGRHERHAAARRAEHDPAGAAGEARAATPTRCRSTTGWWRATSPA